MPSHSFKNGQTLGHFFEPLYQMLAQQPLVWKLGPMCCPHIKPIPCLSSCSLSTNTLMLFLAFLACHLHLLQANKQKLAPTRLRLQLLASEVPWIHSATHFAMS